MGEFTPVPYLLGSIVLLAGLPIVVELCLRVFHPQPPSRLAIYRRHPRLPLFALDANASAYVSTGETSFEVRTDALGLRSSEVGDRAVADFDVVVLGGTNAFGYGVPFEETFVGRLEARYGVRIANAAVPLYGPVEYRMVLEDMVENGFRPRTILVVLCAGTDFNHTLFSKDIQPVDGERPTRPSLRNRARSSHLYRWLTAIYHRRRSSKGEPTPPEWDRRQYRPDTWTSGPLKSAAAIVGDEVGRIRGLAERLGSRLVFVVVPTASMVSQRRAHPDEPTLPTIKTHGILDDLGIEYVDTTPDLAALPAGASHHRFDRHLTRRAHGVVSARVADRFGACFEADERLGVEHGCRARGSA